MINDPAYNQTKDQTISPLNIASIQNSPVSDSGKPAM